MGMDWRHQTRVGGHEIGPCWRATLGWLAAAHSLRFGVGLLSLNSAVHHASVVGNLRAWIDPATSVKEDIDLPLNDIVIYLKTITLV